MFRTLYLAAALLTFAAAPIRAATLSTFDFSGTCSDCSGFGTAELVLRDYTVGTDISSSNFVSFTYNGTNLLNAFTITADQALVAGGSMSLPLPGAETFFVASKDENFGSRSDGNWCVGNACLADYGYSHVWSSRTTAPVGVPEPMTITFLGTGLIGLAALRRKS